MMMVGVVIMHQGDALVKYWAATANDDDDHKVMVSCPYRHGSVQLGSHAVVSS
jgi:hypothetical protein